MKELDEKLSLLLDDYTDENIDAVLDEVTADVNLQYRVRRYQMIGEVMRHELPQAIDTDFHHDVMAKINDQAQASATTATEPTASVPFTARTWFRPFAGVAVAASVALVTVALWQPGRLTTRGAEPHRSVGHRRIRRGHQGARHRAPLPRPR